MKSFVFEHISDGIRWRLFAAFGGSNLTVYCTYTEFNDVDDDREFVRVKFRYPTVVELCKLLKTLRVQDETYHKLVDYIFGYKNYKRSIEISDSYETDFISFKEG